jgi:GMP synthase-like glutamine amidotransferase
MIVLIQFRTDQSGWHEVKCIYEGMDLPYSSYLILNAASPYLTAKEIIEISRKAKGIILGGNAEGGYEDTEPEKVAHLNRIREKMKLVLADLETTNIPILGTCFGHQLLADYLGGIVEADKSQAETGIVPIQLNDQGKNDKIFAGLDNGFKAVVGHKASVTSLDHPEATILASSEKCHVQALKYKNFYTFQFHPELSLQDLLDRVAIYPEYNANAIDYDPNEKLLVKQILKNFLKLKEK